MPTLYYAKSDKRAGEDFELLQDRILQQSQGEFEGLAVGDLSEVSENYRGEVLHINDHGNVTLYYREGGILDEISSMV